MKKGDMYMLHVKKLAIIPDVQFYWQDPASSAHRLLFRTVHCKQVGEIFLCLIKKSRSSLLSQGDKKYPSYSPYSNLETGRNLCQLVVCYESLPGSCDVASFWQEGS